MQCACGSALDKKNKSGKCVKCRWARKCEGCGKGIRPNNKSGKCLDCLGVSNRCSQCGKIVAKDTEHVCASVDLKGDRHCEDCNKLLKNEGSERWRKCCIACEKKRWRDKERLLRRELKIQFGGKCETCNYSRNWAGLQFHHKDSSEKYKWSKKGGASVLEVKAHPERFNLLCSNCHIELHNPDEMIS